MGGHARARVRGHTTGRKRPGSKSQRFLIIITYINIHQYLQYPKRFHYHDLKHHHVYRRSCFSDVQLGGSRGGAYVLCRFVRELVSVINILIYKPSVATPCCSACAELRALVLSWQYPGNTSELRGVGGRCWGPRGEQKHI